MALPTLISVKGTYLKLDGTPEAGTVQFVSPVTVLKSGTASAVVPSVLKATLDETGSFELLVPASDDPAWLPAGWEYRVVLRLTSDFSNFKTVIPHDAHNHELFITELLPAQPGGSQLYAAYNHVHQGYVQESTVDQIVADAITETVGPTIDAAVAAAVVGLGDDFALANHTHAASAIVSGTIALARLPVGVSAGTVAAGDHTHNYDSVYAPLTHTHAYADITGTPTLNKAAVGLANVDNTSDLNKPISTATQAALDTKSGVDHTHATESIPNPLPLVEIATPATPTNDRGLLYARDLNGGTQLAWMTSGGTEYSVLRDVVFQVRNTSGAPILKGTPVYVSNFSSGGDNAIEVAPARANSTVTMPVLGLTIADIANNAYGGCMRFGRLENVNTSAYAFRDLLYVSDVTAGAMVSSQPATTATSQRVAQVARVHASTGVLYVDIQTMLHNSAGSNRESWTIGSGTQASVAYNMRTASGRTSSITATPTANRTWTLPDASGTVALTSELALKANLASPTFTGTVSGITKAMVGLSNVDNTSDANKPVSTATQTALDGKAATSHTHSIDNVTGLQTALDGKQPTGSYALASDITALDTRVDAVEDMTPVVMVWNGSAYVESTTARVYVGPNDPGTVPDGSVWIDTTP